MLFGFLTSIRLQYAFDRGNLEPSSPLADLVLQLLPLFFYLSLFIYLFQGGGATGRNGGHLTPASALHYSDFAKLPQPYLLKHIDPKSLSREEVYGNDRGSKSDETIRKMLTLEQRTSGELIMLIRSEETKKRKAEMKRKAMERIHGPAGKSEQVSNGNESDKIQEEVVDVDLYSGSNWYLCFSEEEEKLCDESLERAKRAGLSDLARNVRKMTREEIDKVSIIVFLLKKQLFTLRI